MGFLYSEYVKESINDWKELMKNLLPKNSINYDGYGVNNQIEGDVE